MSNCSNDSLVGKYDFPAIPQGADVTFEISYKPNNVVLDLSTYSAKLQVRKSYSTPILLELNSIDGSIVLVSSEPNITLHFFKEKTESISVTEGMIYDLEITSATGLVSRVIEGSFSLSKQVTV